MNATIEVTTTGNTSSVIIRRKMGFKYIPVPTTDVVRVVNQYIYNLTSMGYTVKVTGIE